MKYPEQDGEESQSYCRAPRQQRTGKTAHGAMTELRAPPTLAQESGGVKIILLLALRMPLGFSAPLILAPATQERR